MNATSIAQRNSNVADRILPEIYDDLRKFIHRYLERHPGHTLQATEAVHEAYIRMTGSKTAILAKDRLRFFAFAATTIQNLLHEHTKKRQAIKRGYRWNRIDLEHTLAPSPREGAAYTLDLDAAIRKLETLDKQTHLLVVLRFFGGLTMKESATLLQVSERTAASKWEFARRWIRSEIE